MEFQDKTNEVLARIVDIRKQKGFSMENMADEMQISAPAYNKIEKGETKLTLERLFQIQKILDISLSNLLDIKVENIFNQHFSDNSGFYREVQNLYQDNRELTNRFINTLENEIVNLKDQLKIKVQKI